MSPVNATTRDTYACHHCPVVSTSWAAAERHARAQRHTRVDIVFGAS